MQSRRLLAGSSLLLAVACASQGTASSTEPSAPAASNDADAALAKLSERADQLQSFVLLYTVHYPKVEQQFELRFRAPDLARIDMKEASSTQSNWFRHGWMSFRGDDHGAPLSGEVSLARISENEDALDAVLEREFHGSRERASGGKAGPSFQIELLPPDRPEDHGTFSIMVLWLAHVFHRFSWLQPGSAASPWRSEGGELVRELAGGGTIRVSKESGLVTHLSHPAGFDCRLVRSSDVVETSDFDVPPPAPGARDLSSEFAWKMEYGVTVANRGTAYCAMLRRWPASDDGLRFDEGVKRVFAEVYRPLCLRFDADVQQQHATNLANFARQVREVNARTDGTQDERAAIAVEVTRWKDTYEQGVISYGDHYIAGVQVPNLDGVDPPLADVTPDRLARLLALERAAFLAEFRERVVQPAKTRLDAALRSDDPH